MRNTHGPRRKLIGGALASVAALLLLMTGLASAALIPADSTLGDNPKCADLGYPDRLEAESENGNPTDHTAENPGTATAGSFSVDWWFGDDGLIDFAVTDDSEYWVSAAIVKRGDSNSGGGANVYDYEGELDDPVPADSDLQYPQPNSGPEFSHITFCAGDIPPPESADLTVEKLTTGEGAPEEWEFTFTGPNGSFTLDESGSSEELADLDAGQYTITETGGTADFDLTGVECGGEAVAVAEDDSITVTLEPGDDLTCEFTNTYTAPPPESADLTVEKLTTGEGAPEEWEFSFTGPNGSFTLDESDSSEELADLDAGQYTITETGGTANFDLTGVECGGEAVAVAEDDSITVTLEPGDDLTCEFTNTYTASDEEVISTEVLSEELEAEAEEAEPVVAGRTITRTPAAQPAQVEQLAFTGSTPGRLVTVGLAAMFLGAVILLGTRRRGAELY